MKSTKETILKTALALFNTKGLAKVKLRTIAIKMGISQGNLNYHFKKRDEIIEALYFQLVGRIDMKMQKQNEAVDLQSLFGLSATIMENFYDHRFFLLDFVQITRENKKIKKHYLELTATRQHEFLAFFNLLIENGVVRKGILPNEYRFLYKRFQILCDFWISAAQLSETRLKKSTVSEYAHIVNQAIFPYLTEKGRREYYKIEQS